ncbi:hypothetical protein K502DRAFT_331717 [Neoconidiobolus thromboides FSU 785]|nr:hypothetical protein K502DRAFT_331717 [Neoconidiobolus thromboides FSU 785]
MKLNFLLFVLGSSLLINGIPTPKANITQPEKILSNISKLEETRFKEKKQEKEIKKKLKVKKDKPQENDKRPFLEQIFNDKSDKLGITGDLCSIIDKKGEVYIYEQIL